MYKIVITFFLSMFLYLLFQSSSFAQIDTTLSNEIMNIDKNGPKYGTDSAKCVMNLSLYREYYKNYKKDKNKEYLMNSIKPWRWVFCNCPLASQNMYIDGANIVKYMIRDENNPSIKEKLIDILMMVYDRRIEAFSRKGYVLGRKASDLMKYRKNEVEEIYNIFTESFNLEGNNSDPSVLYYYFISATNLVQAKKADSSVVIDVYDKVSSAAEFNIKNNKKTKKYQDALNNIENAASPWLNCKDLVRIYTVKFDKESQNIDFLKKITNLLDKKDCTDSELFFKALTNRNNIEPSAETAYLLGKISAKRSNFNDAAKYFSESIGLFEDTVLKANAYYKLAQVNLAQSKFSSVRANALKGLELTPKDGKFYILIGIAYAQSATSFGDNDLTKKVAYWAAVDKFAKAKSVDNSPDIVNEANSLINSYSKHFPDNNTIFFYNLKLGDTYTVAGWINETTIVRARK